jgi:hypothetical protein
MELERDVTGMKSIGGQFGILVVKWHNERKYLGLVNVDDLEVMRETTGYVPEQKTVTERGKKSFIAYADSVQSYYGQVLDIAGKWYVMFDIVKLREALVEKDKEYE